MFPLGFTSYIHLTAMGKKSKKSKRPITEDEKKSAYALQAKFNQALKTQNTSTTTTAAVSVDSEKKKKKKKKTAKEIVAVVEPPVVAAKKKKKDKKNKKRKHEEIAAAVPVVEAPPVKEKKLKKTKKAKKDKKQEGESTEKKVTKSLADIGIVNNTLKAFPPPPSYTSPPPSSQSSDPQKPLGLSSTSERWESSAKNNFGGDTSRASKFLKLMGGSNAKTAGSRPQTTFRRQSGAPLNTHALNASLSRQFEQGMNQRGYGGGQRRGLGF